MNKRMDLLFGFLLDDGQRGQDNSPKEDDLRSVT